MKMKKQREQWPGNRWDNRLGALRYFDLSYFWWVISTWSIVDVQFSFSQCIPKLTVLCTFWTLDKKLSLTIWKRAGKICAWWENKVTGLCSSPTNAWDVLVFHRKWGKLEGNSTGSVTFTEVGLSVLPQIFIDMLNAYVHYHCRSSWKQ